MDRLGPKRFGRYCLVFEGNTEQLLGELQLFSQSITLVQTLVKTIKNTAVVCGVITLTIYNFRSLYCNNIPYFLSTLVRYFND